MRRTDSGKATATASGVGFCELLGVAFVILKLCGVIDWPWIWVLAPIWGGILLGILALIAFLIFFVWLTK